MSASLRNSFAGDSAPYPFSRTQLKYLSSRHCTAFGDISGSQPCLNELDATTSYLHLSRWTSPQSVLPRTFQDLYCLDRRGISPLTAPFLDKANRVTDVLKVNLKHFPREHLVIIMHRDWSLPYRIYSPVQGSVLNSITPLQAYYGTTGVDSWFPAVLVQAS